MTSSAGHSGLKRLIEQDDHHGLLTVMVTPPVPENASENASIMASPGLMAVPCMWTNARLDQ